MLKKNFYISLIMILILFSPIFSSQNQGVQETEQEPAVVEEEVVEVPPPEIPEEPPEPEPLQGTIRGRLLDELGTPIAGVKVSCIDQEGDVVKETVTDEDGNYAFSDLKTGKYTVTVNYTGISAPLEIQFEEEEKRPPNPTGLRVFEINSDIIGTSFVRAQWDKMENVLSYKCEIYIDGEKEPVLHYEDILNNYFEFGNLKENTTYQIRIFSRNDKGFSTSYALGRILTKNKLPLPPFGLSAMYAKNNRLDLVWSRVKTEEPLGYILKVKKGADPYRFYSKEGFVNDKDDAFIIEDRGESFMGYSIDDVLEDGLPLVENGIPYSVQVFAVDESNALSKPSSTLKEVVLEDTVPPLSPTGIRYDFVSEDRLRISWESKDRDVARFRVYYGLNRDRWDGIVYTDKRYHELIVNREKLKNRELYIAVTAIDRAGNESGYKPLERKTDVLGGEVTQDLVLSFDNIIKDLSPAIKEPPKEVVKKPVKKKVVPKVIKPREYGVSHLMQKGWIIEKGETATLKGQITLPEQIIIRVESGGTLVLDEAQLEPLNGPWGGIRFLEGSKGQLQNVKIFNADIGIAVINNAQGVRMSNVEISGCTENGIFIKDSSADMNLLTIRDNPTGIFIQNSEVSISNSYIENNEKGILAYNYELQIADSNFAGNTVYGLRIYGGGEIKNCLFNNNYVGVAFEKGRGSVTFVNNKVETNRIDGIVVGTSELEIRRSLIAGNRRNGIYVKEKTNPVITESDIINNGKYAVFGGGKITRCFVAYNNGSTYIDDTSMRGKPDSITSSSSSGIVKQIFQVDYIGELTGLSVLQ
ncbi:MAG: right-handed parallel beta-helix repeat-containing protein [Spirochaetota bacterium]|nr:MAG: right-handed parallel beta-helix repeat-containing protein [Spirochaetota bacterium]